MNHYIQIENFNFKKIRNGKKNDKITIEFGIEI